jgi:serine/threonine protein kinase
VALKELVFNLVPQQAQLTAFERECELLRQIDHPRIPSLTASFQDGEGVDLRLYMATALVEGTPLDRVLEGGPVPADDVIRMAREVLAILGDLHALRPRVLHRDIKPQNLLVDARDGHLWLVDFGAARDLRLGITLGTTMVGTHGYIAPEQMAGLASEQSDLYSLGATLLHLSTGKHPGEVAQRGRVPDVSKAGVPRVLRPLLLALLAEDPARRPVNANAALALLEPQDRGAMRWRLAAAVTLAIGIGGSMRPPEPAVVAAPVVPTAVTPVPPPVPPVPHPVADAVSRVLDLRIPLTHDRSTIQESGGRTEEVRCDSPRTALFIEHARLVRGVEVHARENGVDTVKAVDQFFVRWRYVNGAQRECMAPFWAVTRPDGTPLASIGSQSLMGVEPHASLGVEWGWVVPEGVHDVDVVIQAYAEPVRPRLRFNVDTGEATLKQAPAAPKGRR